MTGTAGTIIIISILLYTVASTNVYEYHLHLQYYDNNIELAPGTKYYDSSVYLQLRVHNSILQQSVVCSPQKFAVYREWGAQITMRLLLSTNEP